MLTLYFSATGNSKFIAELFSRKMDSKCLSIEDDVNFTEKIKAHNIIAFCYPIYASRIPRIMREFVAKHMNELAGKKIIIFATQVAFSGDGSRVFTDMFWDATIDVIYAEHFKMPSNVGNVPLWRPNKKKIQRYITKAEAKMVRVCQDIKSGIVKKRGFTRFSQIIGKIQGVAWQGDSKEDTNNRNKSGFNIDKRRFSVEKMRENDVRIRKNCTVCNICVKVCPMKNLENTGNEVKQKGNCTLCYRCVNMCPERAITVLFHRRPGWQYNGPE
ncbi:MAG: EFR1 family ferrodoxin [Defluviitaleaceae bacterium]|nr:EFR1 family ferrodoxin [Defluviitaleaceae bacterium]